MKHTAENIKIVREVRFLIYFGLRNPRATDRSDSFIKK